MTSRHSATSAESDISRISWAMPRTPFMGVRTSWLTTATKSARVLASVSARSRASRNSASTRRRSEISVLVTTKPPPSIGSDSKSRPRPLGRSKLRRQTSVIRLGSRTTASRARHSSS